MSMSGREWLSQYNALKRDVVAKRQEGKQFGASDIKVLQSAHGVLEKELRAMQSASMEFELCAFDFPVQ